MSKTAGEKNWENAQRYRKEREFLVSTGFQGNLREESAIRSGFSVAQGDRFNSFLTLLPEVQNLVRFDNVGLSSVLLLAPHPFGEQKDIYKILRDTEMDVGKLTRDFINCVVQAYRGGKKYWPDIRPDCTEYLSKSKRKPVKKSHNTTPVCELAKLDGREFENWFTELLTDIGFTWAEGTLASHEQGADSRARLHDVNYIFQTKHYKDKSVGTSALQEVWFAKRQNDHVAVVVTSGRISSNARKLAYERGILCWDRKKLQELENARLNKDPYLLNMMAEIKTLSEENRKELHRKVTELVEKERKLAMQSQLEEQGEET